MSLQVNADLEKMQSVYQFVRNYVSKNKCLPVDREPEHLVGTRVETEAFLLKMEQSGLIKYKKTAPKFVTTSNET